MSQFDDVIDPILQTVEAKAAADAKAAEAMRVAALDPSEREHEAKATTAGPPKRPASSYFLWMNGYATARARAHTHTHANTIHIHVRAQT